MVGNPIDLQPDLETYANEDFFFQADTIEELSQKIKAQVPYFDAGTFVKEIDKYNGFSEAGSDPDYNKPAELMWPIEEPPFYAFKIVSGLLNTNGGIRINRNSQVVDPRNKVIEGLYAAGVCTSGWDGEIYGGGTCQTVALWCGSRAARHTVINRLGGQVAPDWMGTEKSVDLLPPGTPLMPL
jgi:fumarate reductase flavoprotein subunit